VKGGSIATRRKQIVSVVLTALVCLTTVTVVALVNHVDGSLTRALMTLAGGIVGYGLRALQEGHDRKDTSAHRSRN
jgi:hypothetical protein